MWRLSVTLSSGNLYYEDNPQEREKIENWENLHVDETWNAESFCAVNTRESLKAFSHRTSFHLNPSSRVSSWRWKWWAFDLFMTSSASTGESREAPEKVKNMNSFRVSSAEKKKPSRELVAAVDGTENVKKLNFCGMRKVQKLATLSNLSSLFVYFCVLTFFLFVFFTIYIFIVKKREREREAGEWVSEWDYEDDDNQNDVDALICCRSSNLFVWITFFHFTVLYSICVITKVSSSSSLLITNLLYPRE